MRIKVTVPKTDEKWSVSFGKTPSRRKDATLCYNLIERRIYARPLKEKLSIVVKYPDGLLNETLVSLDARYLLYTLVCFLEDYLTKEFLSSKYKKYNQK